MLASQRKQPLSVYRNVKSQDGSTNVTATSFAHCKHTGISLKGVYGGLAGAYTNNSILYKAKYL